MLYSQVKLYLDEGYPVKLIEWKDQFWIKENNSICPKKKSIKCDKDNKIDYDDLIETINYNLVEMEKAIASDKWEIATEENCPLYTDYLIANQDNRTVLEILLNNKEGDK